MNPFKPKTPKTAAEPAPAQEKIDSEGVLQRSASKKDTKTTLSDDVVEGSQKGGASMHQPPEAASAHRVEVSDSVALERTKRDDRILKGRAPDIEPFKIQRMPEGTRRPGRWAKGASGNPEGGPISPMTYIRTISANGLEMAVHAFRAMRGSMLIGGTDPYTGEFVEKLVPANGKEQAEARAYLERTGMISELRDVEGELSLNFAALTPEEMREYLRLQRKLEARPTAETDAELV